jgi:hypothetical protein
VHALDEEPVLARATPDRFVDTAHHVDLRASRRVVTHTEHVARRIATARERRRVARVTATADQHEKRQAETESAAQRLGSGAHGIRLG